MTSPSPSEEENKRLYDECYKLLRAEVKLKEWCKEEEKQYERHLLKQTIQLDNTSDALEKYARTSCRQICLKVLKVLPREMRDTIYQYILPASPIVMNIVGNNACRCETCLQGKSTLWSPTHLPQHLDDVDYVPQEFYRELLEQLYRTNTFDFEDNFQKIADFRINDAGTTDIIPVNYPLNISILIKCHVYDFAGTSLLGNQPGPFRPRRALLKELEALFGFKTGTKISVRLQVDFIPGTEKEAWECDTVVPFILPTMRRLAAFGTKVKLCLEDNGCELVIKDGDSTLEEIKDQFEKDQEAARWSNMFAE